MWLCFIPASWKAADSACSSQTDSGHSRRFFAMLAVLTGPADSSETTEHRPAAAFLTRKGRQ